MRFRFGIFVQRFHSVGGFQIRSLFSSSSSSVIPLQGVPLGKKFKPPPLSCCIPSYLDKKGIISWSHVPASNIQIMITLSDTKPNVVFVLGGPGAGKGTQCSRIVDEFGFLHLSAGDLLRAERMKAGSEYGELIEKHIRDGTIVPVEITCSLIERAMAESGWKYFLIDGFPRNQNNLDGWDKQMARKVNVLFVLFFDAPEEVCVDRCLSRGQAGSGRSDDNPDSLKKRVFTYMNDTLPIINHFIGLSLVRKVDASKSADEVFQEVKILFNPIVEQQQLDLLKP